MKRKILFFIPSLAGGGAERTIVNIINHLDYSKFDPVLVMCQEITFDYQKNEYIDFLNKKCKIIYLNCKLNKLSIFKLILELKKCINREKPDLIFSTRLKVNIIAMISKILAKGNVPIVLRESTNRSEEGISKILKLITKYFYNKANYVIALSNGVKTDLVQNFRIKRDKIKVIYNPVDLHHIKNQSKESIEENFLFKGDSKIIISVGRLFEQKDFKTLIKAFKIVDFKIDAKLVILGKGPLEKELKQLAKDLGIENKVYFLGFKKNPYKYIKRANLFVLSSKFEGFGHVIVESMAVGTPVISTDCKSGPGEILENGKYGKLVNVGDSKGLANEIISLLNDSDSCHYFSKIGIERSLFFEAKKIIKEYEDIFLKVTN